MNIIIKTKNIELTDQLKKIVDDKIGGLKKFLEKFKHDPSVLFDTFVYIGKETTHHKKGDIFEAEVKIVLLKKNLFAKAHGENIVRTISEVKDELQEEIKKYKTKVFDIPKRRIQKGRQSDLI